jgi:DDE superfamily endonuclease
MIDIIAVLHCLDQSAMDKTTLRRLIVIVMALLAMTGRVTMLGITRWAGDGGSYRTIQRFFNTKIIWHEILVIFVQHWLADATDIYLLAGDETIVTKAGKLTHGLDRFYSSIMGRPVPGLAFLAFSLISIKRGQSSVIRMEQLTKEQSSQAKKKSENKKSKKKDKKKRKPGRPKGSKNKNRHDVELSPHLQHVQTLLKGTLKLLSAVGISITWFVFDGAFGNNYALQMVRQCGLHLISKMRYDSALYFPYTGSNKRRKYGNKLKYAEIPDKYIQSNTLEDGIRTIIYQMTMWHKLFPDQLNIVIVRKINVKTGKQAHVVLFSSDLDLSYDLVVKYYRLRFQIEFNFRDAKQFWGLEDFMNVGERPVYNAANLSMFMVNVSQVLINGMREKIPGFGVTDLKAHYRGQKYVEEVLKLLPEMPERILIDQIFAEIGALGSINMSAPHP